VARLMRFETHLCVLLARLTTKNKHRNQIRLIVVQFFGTPDAIRDAPVRSPRKADNKKQAPQSNTVDCDAVFWHA